MLAFGGNIIIMSTVMFNGCRQEVGWHLLQQFVLDTFLEMSLQQSESEKPKVEHKGGYCEWRSRGARDNATRSIKCCSI